MNVLVRSVLASTILISFKFRLGLSFTINQRISPMERLSPLNVLGTEVAEEECTAYGEDDETWAKYEEIVDKAKEQVKVRKSKSKQIDPQACIDFIKSRDQLLPIPPFSDEYESVMTAQNEAFIEHSSLTTDDLQYCTQILYYVGNRSAKANCPAPVAIAWRKLQESGIIPRENCYSTYMYTLGISDEFVDLCAEVAEAHDLLFEPNEKTIALRIKMLMIRGDAASAEKMLKSLPVSIWNILADC